MNDLTIYSTPGCPWCEKAKDLCEENGVTFTEIVVGKDIERDEFFKQFPNVKTAPFIMGKDKAIGGYTELLGRYS
jgi:glutaredoxin 3